MKKIFKLTNNETGPLMRPFLMNHDFHSPQIASDSYQINTLCRRCACIFKFICKIAPGK